MMLSNSLGLQANAKNLININTLDDLSVLEKLGDEEILILGAGTNVILGDYFNGTVIAVHLKGIKVSVMRDVILNRYARRSRLRLFQTVH